MKIDNTQKMQENFLKISNNISCNNLSQNIIINQKNLISENIDDPHFKNNNIIKNDNLINNSIFNNNKLKLINNENDNNFHDSQKFLKGKFETVNETKMHSQSSNVIMIPTNNIQINNNITKNNTQIINQNKNKNLLNPIKNEEFISYDTESNDSSPRINNQTINVISNSQIKNIISNSPGGNTFPNVTFIKYNKIEEKNTNILEKINFQEKNSTVSFPIGSSIEEKGS